MQLDQVNTTDPLALATDRARAARDRGLRWLLGHIEANGKPAGSEERNGWGRVPWALALSGEPDTGAAVLRWAAQSQIDDGGDFAAGPARGSTGINPSYLLSHFVIGAWLLGDFALANKTMGGVRALRNPSTGGLPFMARGDVRFDDLLCTAQAGLSAVFAGAGDVADSAYQWILNLVDQQPELANGRLYTLCVGDKLLTEFDKKMSFIALVDFSKAKQAYYYPGMTAAFLTAYAGARGIDEPLEIANRLLQMNIEGSDVQYTDRASVQICKFGWGAAAMRLAGHQGDWIPHVCRMAHWFADWQNEDGSWSPSSFLVKAPGVVDNMIKTAEHVMELNVMLEALGGARAEA